MNTQQIPATNEQMQHLYLHKVNALVATDREHLIADITAEYATVIDANAKRDQHAAA
jgi:hypothetical protein